MAYYRELANILRNPLAKDRVQVAMLIKARSIIEEPEPEEGGAAWLERQRIARKMARRREPDMQKVLEYVLLHAPGQLLLNIGAANLADAAETALDEQIQGIVNDAVEEAISNA